MDKQVEKEYYFKDKYLTLERFISYYYQIKSVRKSLEKGKILFIGPGDKVVSNYLDKSENYQVSTFDIDKDLEPDHLGDIRELPFAEDEYDLVVAFEVLEHVEYKYFEKILKDFKRISRGNVAISLPYLMTSFEFVLKFPGIRTLLKRDYIRFAFDIPLKFPGFKVSGQHYWEIDRKEFKISRIRKTIKNVFNIKEEKRPVLDRYHVFFDLSPKDNIQNMDSEFAKNYYDETLSGMKENYSKFRWKRNKTAKYDYWQTKMTIDTFVRGKKFYNVLEIGPGDGTWTKFFLDKSDNYTVIDKSSEMLKRLKENLENENINYVQSDFLKYEVSKSFDTVIAIRCFEYFSDKKKALMKIYDALENGGKALIITKNSQYIRSVHKEKRLHSGQISVDNMVQLAKDSGFIVKAVYPATVRVKSKYLLSRLFFGAVLSIGLVINSRIYNKLWDFATESYAYVLYKK